jgi:hypothetical protein
MTDAAVTSTPQYDQCLQRLSLLEEALMTKDPEMKKHLAEIHKLLISFEELSHLLTNDEIAKIMAAQQIVTDTVLIGSTSGSKKASATKKSTGLSLGDL